MTSSLQNASFPNQLKLTLSGTLNSYISLSKFWAKSKIVYFNNIKKVPNNLSQLREKLSGNLISQIQHFLMLS